MPNQPTLLGTPSLHQYFQEEVNRACRGRRPAASGEVRRYLGDLLSRFARSERFFDRHAGRRGLRPLALVYGDALSARGEQERRVHLQRLGDVALFFSGLFSGAFERMTVDIDYYVAMGAGAYGSLADTGGGVFGELSEGFVRWVDLLAEVSHRRRPFDTRAILQLAGLWRETGDPLFERHLRQLGVVPAGSRRFH